MKFSIISRDFIKGSTLNGISQKNHCKKTEIRRFLIHNLGRKQYLKIAHSNGGKAVAKKLRDPNYKARFVSKMRLSVRRSLTSLMRKKTFRKAWHKKAREGSIKGIMALRNYMNDPRFYKRWLAKCKIGGLKTYTSMKGFHAAPVRSRRRWSLLGLKKTGRKIIGPKGEKMYNSLEVLVASMLNALGITYKYEKILLVENQNGFVSVDFVVPQMPNVFIETTYWSKPDEKILELERKWGMIRSKCPTAKMIVVTTQKRITDYKRLSEKNIKVFVPNEFREYITKSLHLAG